MLCEKQVRARYRTATPPSPSRHFCGPSTEEAPDAWGTPSSHAPCNTHVQQARVGRLFSAPWRAGAGAGNASDSVTAKTVKFGWCSPPHLMWDMQQRVQWNVGATESAIGNATRALYIPESVFQTCFVNFTIKHSPCGQN